MLFLSIAATVSIYKQPPPSPPPPPKKKQHQQSNNTDNATNSNKLRNSALNAKTMKECRNARHRSKSCGSVFRHTAAG